MDELKAKKIFDYRELIRFNNASVIIMEESLVNMSVVDQEKERMHISMCNLYTEHIEAMITALESDNACEISTATKRLHSVLNVMNMYFNLSEHVFLD